MWHQGEQAVCSVGAGSDTLLSVLVWQCHCSTTLTRVPVLHSSEVLNLQWFGGSGYCSAERRETRPAYSTGNLPK